MESEIETLHKNKTDLETELTSYKTQLNSLHGHMASKRDVPHNTTEVEKLGKSSSNKSKTELETELTSRREQSSAKEMLLTSEMECGRVLMMESEVKALNKSKIDLEYQIETYKNQIERLSAELAMKRLSFDKTTTTTDVKVMNEPSTHTNSQQQQQQEQQQQGMEELEGIKEERNELRSDNAILLEKSLALYEQVEELQRIITNLENNNNNKNNNNRNSNNLTTNGVKRLQPSSNQDHMFSTEQDSVDFSFMSTENDHRHRDSAATATSEYKAYVPSSLAQKIGLPDTNHTIPTPTPLVFDETAEMPDIDMDQHRFVLRSDSPIVYIEIGAFVSRVGVWNATTHIFELK